MAARLPGCLQNVQVFEAGGISEDYDLIVWLNPPVAGELAQGRETSGSFGAKKDSFSTAGTGISRAFRRPGMRSASAFAS